MRVRATQLLAEFVSQSRWEDIPEPVRREGVRTLLNSIGCAVGGCRDAAIEIAIGVLAPNFGPPRAGVIGRRERADPLSAAFLNTAAANVLEYDDTHLPTVMHPGAPVMGSAFALAETRPTDGAALLHAAILGVEVGCRIGNALMPTHYRRGWHITATCGIFSAAAAAGKLLGLDSRHMAWALGHAATQSAGLVESLGSMSKSIGVGNAGRNGLAAALFAEAGLTAADQAIEGRYGFAPVTSDSVHLEAITDRLGERWEIADNAYKPYPCGVVLFPVLDACLDLYARHRPAPETIERIVVRGHPLLRERTDRPDIDSDREARVSLQHSVAVAFLFGAAGLHQYTQACVADPAVRGLRARVTGEDDPGMPVESAAVAVHLRDGRVLQEHVSTGRGTPARPMSDAELDAKVRELIEFGAPSLDAAALIAAIRGIETETDAARIVQLTVPR